MSTYQYKTGDETLSITDTADGSVFITRSWHDSQGRLNHRMMDLSAVDRQAAAQALAGDEWRVVATEHIYPHRSGDYIVLGPETFSDTEKTVISHKGENYYARQDEPPTIDPADVKVGDVVEVEADDGSWLVRGKVTDIDPYHDPVRPFGITLHFHRGVIWPELFAATVRLVRRAEPEPDPEHIKALEAVLDDAGCGDEDNHSLARELVRRGVTVRKEN